MNAVSSSLDWRSFGVEPLDLVAAHRLSLVHTRKEDDGAPEPRRDHRSAHAG